MKWKYFLCLLACLCFSGWLLLKPYAGDASPFPLFPILSGDSSTQPEKTAIPSAKQLVQVDSVQYPTPKLSVLGYYAEDWPGDMRALQDLSSHAGSLDGVMPFAYTVTETGGLSGTATAALATAKQNGLQTYALVHNYSGDHFDADLIHKILANPTSRHTLAQNIRQMVAANGFQGVHFDLEAVSPSDRASLTSLIQETASLLHAGGYTVSVALPAKKTDSLNDDWAGGFDYNAIGKAVDFVVVMTYDEHWSGATPGPIASYSWVEQVISYAVTQISPAKIYLGVAAYGYDWASNKKQATAVLEKSLNTLAASHGTSLSWDDFAQESHFTYVENGISHTVWGETPTGLDMKIQLAKRYQLKGIAIWRLGFTDDAYWNIIRSYR
jgi:spore germination protein